ncbi:MAG: hypothetical protein WBB49_00720 [Microgenomates group bacterium]
MRNLKTYHRAWELRQQGNTYSKIAEIMGYTHGAWVRTMCWITDQKIATQKRLPNELKLLVEKYVASATGSKRREVLPHD